ncbi:beta-lactamase/transpeptidase-like protein [Penicillium chrysogenum]|uniref:beta-lactamase/transpeptidase-like protein n=1 Tax=Penicillium chrysogenum TaxID=5076 RepID=UPI0024DF1A3F|nr:beta-lactamase/transpeptidase-like protein [Penicillium chrysogenum]KAJ5245744.1 beta-lactamase/transpeptidase-like protein [Penicillium chrysogenum]
MLFPLSFVLFEVFVSNTLAAIQLPLLAHEDQSQKTPLNEVFDQKVKWALEHFDIPGLAIAVVRDDVFCKGYGVSDMHMSKPVTEHTLFFTGSTTKAFTSAAISLLVDDVDNHPAIRWDTPVHTILPADFVLNDPWSTSHTTIADILSHRSGLPRHDWVWLANITLQEVVQSMRHLPLTAEPRTKWQYCNLMYSAAAHLIETVTNQSLHTFLTKNIWQPLNMSETYLSFSEAQDMHHDISQGYYVDSNGKIASTNQVFSDTIRGAGNVLSSVADYAKWVSAILNRKPPLSKTSYATLLGGHSIISPNPVEPFGSPLLYGLGWMSQTYKGEMLVFHEGAQFGGDKIINDTNLPDNTISELYPMTPHPPLPNPLKISAYEGTYTHPVYPDLRVSSSCSERETAIQGLQRKLPDLCVSIVKYNQYSQYLISDLFHVSGMFWVQIATHWGVTNATRVEFRIDSKGMQIAASLNISQTEIEDVYQCTPLQEALITLSTVGSAAYVKRIVLSLRSDIDLPKFRSAVQDVVRATSILRTRIVQFADISFVQVVLNESIQWSSENGTLEEFLEKGQAERWGIGDPLLRHSLIVDSQVKARWIVWTIHHAIYDGWSFPIMAEHVSKRYNNEPIEPTLQYNDFVRHILQSDSDQHGAYWRWSLAGNSYTQFPLLPNQSYMPNMDSTFEHLTRDASAPQHLPEQEKKCIEMDPELNKLKIERNAFRHELIAEYHQLTKARKADPARYDRYRRLQNQVRAKREKLHTDAKDKMMYDNFFEHVGNHIIDQNYQGIPVEFEPDTSHIQPERKVLADLEFKNRDVDTVDDAELVEDRIRSLELRLELHQRNIPKPLRKRVKFEATTKKPDQPPFMMKSSTGLECPVCLGCTSSMHQTARQFAYARKDVLQKHFKTHKLPRIFPKGQQFSS